MNDMTEPARLATAETVSAPPRRRPRRAIVAAAAALAAAGLGIAYIVLPHASESTDNAYLRADATSVAPQVHGRVAEVLVRDNQAVHAGDPLVRLDAAEFAARVAQSEAEQQAAAAAVEVARATLAVIDAEERVARSNSDVVEADIRAAQARRQRATLDEQRYARLAESGAVARREAEITHTAAVGADAEAQRSRAALVASRDQEHLARSRRAGAVAALAQAQANLARAAAHLDLARQDAAHAVVRSAVDGVVGALQVRVGDYVQVGTRMMDVVPLKGLYAVAYFKETQTARMQTGQPAKVELDALPGRPLQGRVDSLAPGTGSAFAFLPFEPGTGNFTKVVQRVPVRIALELPENVSGVLRAGLSAVVTVRLDEAAGPQATARTTTAMADDSARHKGE